jgi:DNA polymerase I
MNWSMNSLKLWLFKKSLGFHSMKEQPSHWLIHLRARRAELDSQLQDVFPPVIEERISAKTGRPLKPKVTVFNPASRPQTADRLRQLYPEITFEETEKGNPKVDDDVLEILGERYPEAKLLGEYQLLNKRLGQLADGKEAWLKHCRLYGDGRIHGQVVTNACISGRCSHRSPNMAQVPVLATLLVLSVGLCFMLLMVGFWLVLMLLD